MKGRVSNMRVSRQSGGCPIINLRGQKTFGSGNPQVYVNDSRIGTTCVLDQIRAADVDRIEVYPNGVTNRPGYTSSPFGLIAVFLVGAASVSR
jgi:hypothetical protein